MTSAAAAPLVSVIVPAFNAEATLGDSVRSALDGSYRNIEVIVVDDSSTDATPKLASELAAADSRVQVHRTDRGGVSAALNAGLALARNDYVARLDSDDLWHPDKLQRQVELARTDPEAAFIYTFVRYINGEARVVCDGPQQRFPRHALCRGLCESLVGGNSSALIRRSVVGALGGYDERLTSWEDLLLQLRISAAHPIAFVPRYLVGYRIRPESLSADPRNMLGSWRQARRTIEQSFPSVPPFVRNWAHGKRCAELAESFAWRGDFLRSAALLVEAARHDPRWTARFLGYRMARRWRRSLAPRGEAEPGPFFRDCNPAEQFRPGEYEAGLEGRRLKQLETERARRLAELDERLACEPGGDG